MRVVCSQLEQKYNSVNRKPELATFFYSLQKCRPNKQIQM